MNVVSEVDQNEFSARISLAGAGKTPVYLLTPKATFFVADRLLNKWRDRINNPTFISALQNAVGPANKARWDIQNMASSLHVIFPDRRNKRVREFIAARHAEIQFPEGSTMSAYEESAKWVKELIKERRKREYPTELHLLSYVPTQRVLLTAEWCLFQAFPVRSPGFLEPLYLAERRADTDREFQALTAIFEVLSWTPAHGR
jgi:hypothetical protein